jgi:Hemopexin
MWTQIDTCLVWPNGKAYLLSGSEYVRYDIASDRVDPGYPQPIEGNWPGLWSPAGAGVVWPNGKAYFLRGSEYVRYDTASDRVDPGYPKPIEGNWPGLSLKRVDAAIVWPNGKAYLFGLHGVGFGQTGYVRYDIGTDRQDAGYPQPIEGNWRGLPSLVNACVVWPNGKAYFFAGTEYWRYDIQRDEVDPGYPKPIAGNWPGVPIASPGPPPPPPH